MMYKKLKRTWSAGTINYIPNFRKMFPELSKVQSEELCRRFQSLNIEFYYEEVEPVNILIRLTLPFAIILILLMLVGLPFVFLITGKWHYSHGKKNRILNWFRALRLFK